jgi:hypothetical protein
MPLLLPVRSIATAYTAGATIAQLAATYGCSTRTVTDRLRQAGVIIRRTGPARVCQFNERYFRTIRSERQAYWLGFIFADGGVQQMTVGNWICTINLAIRDAGQLYKLANDIGYSGEIKFDRRKHRSARLILCSKQLCADLIKLGCVPRKTFGCQVPDLPDRLLRHFFRGYVDGDGSFSRDSRSWHFETVGSPKLISAFQDWLVLSLGLRYTKLRQRKTVNTLHYGGNRQVAAIADLLYSRSKVALDRKFWLHQQIVI